MTEKSIIFNTPMVQAILDGRKTQARRVVKPQPELDTPMGFCTSSTDKNNIGKFGFCLCSEGGQIEYCKSPYRPGDILWVRETWNGDWCDHVIYKANGGSAKAAGYSAEPKWKPSIHMPRTAARIFLRIVGVGVERVQEISEVDALSEGISYIDYEADIFSRSHFNYHEGVYNLESAAESYKTLWNKLHAKDGYNWDVNPWCWVCAIKRVDESEVKRNE